MKFLTCKERMEKIRKIKDEAKKPIECKSCGMEISRTAKTCPYCGELASGEKVAQAGKAMIFFGLGFIGVIGLVAFGLIIFAIIFGNV